jgi:hypothetical protein
MAKCNLCGDPQAPYGFRYPGILSTLANRSRAYPMPKGGGDLPALRLILLFEAKRARDMRQSKLAAAIEADLRSVTHQILTKGK